VVALAGGLLVAGGQAPRMKAGEEPAVDAGSWGAGPLATELKGHAGRGRVSFETGDHSFPFRAVRVDELEAVLPKAPEDLRIG